MFVKIDKLSDIELNTILAELNPLFEKDFSPSGIIGSPKIEPTIRDSESYFPKLNQVFDSSLILQLRAKEMFGGMVEFDKLIPDVQLLKYSPGQFYKWHQDVTYRDDGSSIVYDEGSERTTRIITVSANINDDYTEGGLEVKYRDEVIKLPSEKGSIAIFPSFLTHRAVPVKTGCRYAITLWIKGDVYKLKKLNDLYNHSTSV